MQKTVNCQKKIATKILDHRELAKEETQQRAGQSSTSVCMYQYSLTTQSAPMKTSQATKRLKESLKPVAPSSYTVSSKLIRDEVTPKGIRSLHTHSPSAQPKTKGRSMQPPAAQSGSHRSQALQKKTGTFLSPARPRGRDQPPKRYQDPHSQTACTKIRLAPLTCFLNMGESSSLLKNMAASASPAAAAATTTATYSLHTATLPPQRPRRHLVDSLRGDRAPQPPPPPPLRRTAPPSTFGRRARHWERDPQAQPSDRAGPKTLGPRQRPGIGEMAATRLGGAERRGIEWLGDRAGDTQRGRQGGVKRKKKV
jgi:hypothetical protein